MCTLIILSRPGHAWPLILAANRDEMTDRPWHPPARHWSDRTDVVAGLDVEAGGTWLGINDEGLVAGVLNRPGALGPDPAKRSRGELVLEALDHADADRAADALGALDGASYRPFNLVIADNRDAFWLKSTGNDAIEATPVPAGLSMITAHDLNDPQSGRICHFRPRFEAAPAPDPEAGEWAAWQDLLAAREPGADAGLLDAMRIEPTNGFGTLSSSLVALGADGQRVYLFSKTPPGDGPWLSVF
jgi:uncharacterized protein with NRDE domain